MPHVESRRLIHIESGRLPQGESQSDPTHSVVVILFKLFKTEKTIEIQLVRPTGVCGKVLSEKYVDKSFKTALLFSNVIDADHQNSCYLQRKAIFHHLYGC